MTSVLFILDNDPETPQFSHPTAEVVFLPPDATLVLQPKEQGVIKPFELY
jgi:hypothetical protein